MTYAVIGTGAIGGYYGGKLAHAGQEVHFLLHSDYDFVKEHGMQIDSCDGSFHLDNVLAYNDSASMPQVDVVIVGLKTINNHRLTTLLPPLLKPSTIVLLIQNGIGVEADVQAMFPSTQLAAGLAFICSAKTEPGKVNHQAYGSINIGNYSCCDLAAYNQLLDDFTKAGITTNNVEYNEARWRKAVWNMPFNGMTVALNTQTNLLLQQPEVRNVIREQMLEVIHAAWACGVNTISEDFADAMIQSTLDMVPYSPSMKLDFIFHRPMEIDYIYTRPLQIAKEHGFIMPRLQMLEAELRFIEAQNKQQQS